MPAMANSLLKSTSIVSAMTFISRLLGFIRDMLAAQIFGINAEVDAFLVAFKLPNFMRSLFAEGSFSQAFVPTLGYYRQTQSHEKTARFIRHISGCLSLILFIITLLGILFMPFLVKLNAPGFDHQRYILAIHFCRITFPYLMLISLTALTGAILNNYGKFGIPALAPALLNICLIFAALYGSRFFHIAIESQAWGILAAGFVQLGFQLPFLKKLGFLNWPRINFQDPGVKRVLTLMLPAIFGASIVQIGLLINTIFASFLPVGSISWLYYAERLAYFPQGVFGVALATVVLPHLSQQYAKKSQEGFTKAMDWGIRCNLLIGMPASLMMGLLSGPLVSALFQYGHFISHDVIKTQQSVIAYAIGLQAFMLAKILSTGFYARQNIKTPVKIGIVTVGVNIILNSLLIHSLQHAGLALATSLASYFNIGLLLYFLYQQKIFRFQSEHSGWRVYLLRLLWANMAMGIWLYIGQGHLASWLAWTGKEKLEHLFMLIFIAILIYLSTLALSGLRIRHFYFREH